MTKTDIINEHTKKVNLIFEDCNCWDIIDKVLSMPPDAVLSDINASGLKGRGGAGFPTGLKWKSAKEQPSNERFVICNADEGEPGTFKDRQILHERAHKVFTGMTLCAHTIGNVSKGYLYLRAEYNDLLERLQKDLDEFNEGLKARNFPFTINIISGSGAYVCGEETALLDSMEGKRGEPRNKPPFPTVSGFKGKPTVINNVETLVYCTMIMLIGPEEFLKLGTKDSRGAKVFCISGDADVKGIYELELGMKVDEFVELFGDGDTKAVQVGGSSGHCVPRKKFSETFLGFEGVPTGGSMMLFNSSRSMYHVLHNYLEFFQEESCGLCTPCRIGCQQLLRGIEAVKRGEKPSTYLDELIAMARTMRIASKCGLGQSVPNPFISIVENFREEIIY
ncbi:NADH-ubiquinone oxidoreductase-F iron-sulfur binding region domain-containing protein [Oscillibacter sp.]|uniref:NADH-ubiquinone oxidoreductase-F iron-sulfur binding region domain-containing protein n=1 Tax=Oscillibacter sp. TaxID=1945593 RepID=UPI002638ED1B|nr:NADH-ubiquinone oxidoreductase-F iron-sulfur binding region domain-containing protein [Oscillibacter sp.]MDD3347622.1 NADH-ubiquinone oxidoreductase-F iron-sulfur binding region domain-containing protein [Oscillibacter sp.]